MLTIVVRRVFYGFWVFAGVIIIVFALFQLLPGDPALLTLGQRSDVQTLESARKELGLDKPAYKQFLLYLNDLSPVSLSTPVALHNLNDTYIKIAYWGNYTVVLKWPYLRTSYQNKAPTLGLLLNAFPNTLVLAMSAILIAAFLGVPLGIISAVKQNTLWDKTLLFIGTIGISTPSFFAALILQWLLAYVWHQYTGLPLTGSLYETDIYTGRTHLALQNLIIPSLVLGIRPVALITQITRTGMLQVLSQDYMRTARAKGLSFGQSIINHGLKNTSNTLITAVSGWFAELLAGSFFVETIMGWHGLGKLTVDALEKNDFPVVMGSVLFTAFLFVFLNIAVDIIYSIVDPRIAKN